LLVPLIYCFGLIEDAFPGLLGKTMANGVLVAVMGGLFALIFTIMNERK